MTLTPTYPHKTNATGVAGERRVRYLIFLLFALFLSQFVSAAVSIDSTKVTESTCQANGSIEVIANGNNGPFIYSIIGGPVTRPVQSSRFFLSLQAGNYTVQVQNQTGETVSVADVVVPGNYQLMTVKPLTVIACTNSSNGYIIGNLVSGGKGPYTWQLVTPSPVVTSPQASDTFYNLPDGSYTIRVTDDCGNFQTTGAVLSSVPSTFTFLDYYQYLICNDRGIVNFRVIYANLQFPMTVTLYDDRGDSTVMIINDINGYTPNGTWNVIADYNSIQMSMPLAHSVMGNVPWHAVITNGCGASITVNGHTATVITPMAAGIVNGSCPPRLGYSAYAVNDQGFYTFITMDSLKYYLYDETLNMVTDSGISQGGAGVVTNGVVGHMYHFLFINSCGVKFTSLSWVWADPAPPQVYPYPVGRECLDSTINIEISWQGFNVTSPLLWVIKSGPPYMRDTKPGFEYFHTLSYPDTFMTTPGSTLEIANLPPGDYTFSVEDSCGQRIDSIFTILPEHLDIKNYTFKSIVSGQCGIFNAIDLYITRGDKYAYPFPYTHFTYTITNISTGQVIETDNLADSVEKMIYNIPNGTYTLQIDFYNFTTMRLFLNNNNFCTTIHDTIVVKGSPFPHIDNFLNSFCKAQVTTEVVIDSFGGVAPYTYEIIAGPQTFPPQTSNVFNLPVIGAYTFRIADACGNSYVSATDIDTLRFPAIQVSNTPCPGANVLLMPVISPFYSYNWRTPSGNSFSGDTLSVPNVSSADTGIYTVTRYADINGCKDTLKTTLHLEMLARVHQTITTCTGDTVMIGTHSHTTNGIYVDTLTAAGGCDSIVTTDITFIPKLTSTQSVNVCQNQTFTVGTHVHFANDTSVHVVYDTLASSIGCDSIVTTNLTINVSFSKLTQMQICQGDTVWLPRELHYSGGTYIDTVAVTASQILLTGLYQQTNGCDSSYSVHVTVGTSYFTTAFDTTCAGRAVRGHTQSGYYLDTLKSVTGCDSVILLLLTVKNADTTFVSRAICSGQSVNGHSATGVYTDTLQSINGCDSIVILTLNVGPYSQDSIVRQICTGGSFEVGIHSYTQTGIYRDTLSNINCDSIVILNLQVSSATRDTIARTICSGQTITIGAHSYNQTGTYTDTFSTVNCDSIVLLKLLVSDAIRDTLARNICSGQSVTVGQHSYNQSGIYADTITTVNCDSIIVLRLTVNNYTGDSTGYYMCEGGSVTIGQNTYRAAGIYRDTIPSLPCDSIVTFSINIYPSPVIRATTDKTIVETGDSVQLNVIANQFYTYYWTSATSLNNNTIINPMATITAAGWFVVMATDTHSLCTTTDSVFVDVQGKTCKNIFIPNVFTPNDNGVNDVFKIFTLCTLVKLKVQIYNRWGEKVFESVDPDFRWNGYYKGELQDPSVFIYYVQGAFEDGESFTDKGSVTLVR